MRQSLGETRSSFSPNHAVISQDSHERITLPQWPKAALVHLITPALGAEFSLFLVDAEGDVQTGAPAPSVERFVLVLSGEARVVLEANVHRLGTECYAFVPAGTDYVLQASAGAKILVLERIYVPLAGAPPPKVTFSSIGAVPANPMKGDTGLLLQKLLPEEPGLDLEVNVMSFQPGASLPYVETHFMEHGLLMLDGGGIYRLDDAWYPVAKGDAIWMGPFCAQWFGAIGKSDARYLIYKNWNRDPLAPRSDHFG